MTASLAYDPERMTGFKLEQLADAFDRIRNPRDWKAPIRAVIRSEERLVVEQAVLWFTDSLPAFVPAAGEPDRLVVHAPGYRHGPTGAR